MLSLLFFTASSAVWRQLRTGNVPLFASFASNGRTTSSPSSASGLRYDRFQSVRPPPGDCVTRERVDQQRFACLTQFFVCGFMPHWSVALLIRDKWCVEIGAVSRERLMRIRRVANWVAKFACPRLGFTSRVNRPRCLDEENSFLVEKNRQLDPSEHPSMEQGGRTACSRRASGSGENVPPTVQRLWKISIRLTNLRGPRARKEKPNFSESPMPQYDFILRRDLRRNNASELLRRVDAG